MAVEEACHLPCPLAGQDRAHRIDQPSAGSDQRGRELEGAPDPSPFRLDVDRADQVERDRDWEHQETTRQREAFVAKRGPRGKTELGHVLEAKRQGLPVSAPMFIPFMGAFIALRDAPKNA